MKIIWSAVAGILLLFCVVVLFACAPLIDVILSADKARGAK